MNAIHWSSKPVVGEEEEEEDERNEEIENGGREEEKVLVFKNDNVTVSNCSINLKKNYNVAIISY